MLATFFAACAGACSVDTIPTSLRATPAGTGPEVQFDLFQLPLPNIPMPNDVATFPDPTSRTGRRINASVTAPPTYMERTLRAEFNELEGWGTTAPITVGFTPEPGADPHLPALDLNDLRGRMQADGYDLSNDAVYLVNLDTGVPALVDLGGGDFPATIVDGTGYYPNDPHQDARTTSCSRRRRRARAFSRATTGRRSIWTSTACSITPTCCPR